MKRNAGVALLLAVLFAGTHLALRQAQTSPAVDQAVVAAARHQEATPSDNSCPAFSDPETEEDSSSNGKITSLVQRYLYGTSTGAKDAASSLPENIRFMILTAPDPIHTHLGLQFDRTLEALQQALQDEGYTYDSSWLPWKSQSEMYQSLQDDEATQKETSRREHCPGLILFRRSMNAHSTEDSPPCKVTVAAPQGGVYLCGMFVFLIAETPTSGLNQAQWQNAQWWMNAHASGERPDKALRILGPTFSGSMPSVVRALDGIDVTQSSFKSALLYSGRIRGCSSWRWLNHELNGREELPVRTSDFNENDSIQIDRFFRYLDDRGHALSEVAVLSEDETAYGGLPDPPRPKVASPEETPQPECEPRYLRLNESGGITNSPVHLYYPRDISAVRSAYREQSIFAPPAPAETSNSTHTVLQPHSVSTTPAETDSIEQFSGQGVALTEEAQLYGIVNTLRAHAIRFIILRSTNSLDNLFLTRFLRRAYPEAYIVTMGTDMLFGREVDSTEFRGVMALSPFPLLPRGQDWTMQTSSASLLPQHAHRVFGSDLMEGVYLAARFLATDCEVREDIESCGKSTLQTFIHRAKSDLPDYAEPFWEHEPKQLSASTWLSVVGRGGYWPVAVLKEPFFKDESVASNLTNVRRPQDSSENRGLTAQGWFTLSSAWKFFSFLSLLLIGAHSLACLWGWQRSDLSIFIQFAPLPSNRQLALRSLGWAIVCSLMLFLLAASARMFYQLRGVDQLWVWIAGACVLAGCSAALIDLGVFSARKPKDASNAIANVSSKSTLCATVVLSIVAASGFTALFLFDYFHPNGVTVAFRSVHLTSGVSPMVSLLLMLAGFYWWFWQALAGLSLLGPGRPILPHLTSQSVSFSRVSSEMAKDIEAAAIPFPGWNGRYRWLYLLPLLLLILLACVMQRPWTIGFDAVLHSLESKSFNWTLHGMFALGLYLLMLDCCQLLITWSHLKRLLLALNRLPLRRTFAAFQGLSMHSLWTMSGTSSRTRYTIFSHQIESLIHLRNELDSFEGRNCGTPGVRFAIRRAVVEGLHFIETRSEGADLAMSNDEAACEIRKDFSRCAEEIVKDLLVPEWFADQKSLDLRDPAITESAKDYLPLSEEQPVRLAEEFVCLVYLAYLQNMLARMRTIVLSMTGVFAMIALSVAFYPYTPRQLLSLSLLLILLALGAAVALVYAGLERDSTLSRITNTEPGSLGLDFWVRIVSFAGIPALGLLAAQFPEIADFVSSWIEPGMNAVK